MGHRKERIALPTADVNVGRRAVERQRADLAIAFAAALDLDRHHPAPLLPRIWGLRGVLTAYEAAYVALAEALGAPLLTCDRRLARAPGRPCAVETAV